jgi:hypothetical protein
LRNSTFKISRDDLRPTSSLDRLPTPSWIVVAILVLLGAAVGTLGLAGVLGTLALAYCGLSLVYPGTGLAWAFVALPLATPKFQLAGINFQPFELVVWPACLTALVSGLARGYTLKAADLRNLAPLLTAGGYFIVASLLLWGDSAPVETRMWSGALVFGLACYLMAEDPDFQRNLPRALIFSAVGLCLVGLSQHYLGSPAFQGVEEPRDLVRLLLLGNAEPVRLANLTFDHFNSAGAYLTLLVAVLFGISLSRRSSLGLWSATLVAVVTLYLTYSRGAAIATVAGIVATTFLVVRGPWRFALTAGTAAAAAFAVILVVPRLIASDYATTMNLGVRALIWQAYLQAWSASPVFGLGPGNGFITAQFLSPFGDQYAAHSNFLYLASDYGMMGILAAVYGFGAVVVRGLRMEPTHRRAHPYLLGAVAVVTALLVHSLVDHTLVIFSYRVALFAIVAVALKRLRERPEPLPATMP